LSLGTIHDKKESYTTYFKNAGDFLFDLYWKQIEKIMKRTLLFATLMLIGFMSQANTITVTNTNDSGPGSLREASVNAASGDTIRFSSSLLTAAVDSISLSTEIDFGTKVVVIKGLYTATDTLFISGANNSRIFHFGATGDVYLDSLVLINGNGAGSFLNGNGGAILFSDLSDTVYVKNSVIHNNSAFSSGGGIFCYGASPRISIENVTLSNNSAVGNGGGIYIAPYQVSENHLIVHNSTISGNTANTGAGIYTLAEITLITMTNSTVVYNTAITSNGGIDVSAGTTGRLDLENSTVAFNQAPTAAGIYIIAAWNPVLYARNSIVIENGPNASGIAGNLSLVSNGYNIYSDNLPSVPFSQNATTDLLSQSLASVDLAPLDFYGGTTKTMKPLSGSVAIDAGDPADLSAAQNGLISGVRDIGAAESCNATVSSFSITECTSYTVPSGNTTYTTAGTYTVNDTIANAAGCDSLMTIALTISDPVDVSTTLTGVTISANATGTTYQWIDCGNNNAPINGETGASYTATSNGDYAVIVTDGNCSDTSSCVTIAEVGIGENAFGSGIKIYPNPTSGIARVDLGAITQASVTLMDYTGKELSSKSLNQTEGNIVEFSMDDFSAGVYFVRIEQGDQQKVLKLIRK